LRWRLVRYVLYALLVAAPISRTILQFPHGDFVPLFDLTEIASPWAFARSVRKFMK
jgi:hypothetical protein